MKTQLALVLFACVSHSAVSAQYVSNPFKRAFQGMVDVVRSTASTAAEKTAEAAQATKITLHPKELPHFEKAMMAAKTKASKVVNAIKDPIAVASTIVALVGAYALYHAYAYGLSDEEPTPSEPEWPVVSLGDEGYVIS